MTAFNVAKWRDGIVVISDGAAYNDEGVLLSVGPKIDLLPHFSGFVFHSGGAAWSPAVAAVFGGAEGLDDLFDRAGALLQFVEGKFAGISSVDLGLVYFGGWSESRKEMRLGVVGTEEGAKWGGDIAANPYEVTDCPGDNLLCKPALTDADWRDGCPVKGFSHLSEISEAGFEDLGSFLLRGQRAVAGPGGFRGVGAFGQIAWITKERCTTRVFERYDDVVGEVMHPQPVDWAAWRAARAQKASNVDMSGLSRLQRERMEKKLKKGTLR